MPATEAMKLYAIFSSVIALHLLVLAGWTGGVRFARKAYVNPEDAKLNKAEQADVDHPDVQRVKRAHQNALENAIPFFAVGFLYAGVAPNKNAALVYFATFTAARVLHSIFYLWGRQPFRTIVFAIGAACTVGMAVQVIRTAI
ncbi:MAG: MAPEG family protein [Myxococcales bacterium]|nr:MAPEG family protein [Myxococcales bacterium]